MKTSREICPPEAEVAGSNPAECATSKGVRHEIAPRKLLSVAAVLLAALVAFSGVACARGFGCTCVWQDVRTGQCLQWSCR